MDQQQISEKIIEDKILRYEQQIRGLSHNASMYRMVLKELQRSKPVARVKKIEQLTFFGT